MIQDGVRKEGRKEGRKGKRKEQKKWRASEGNKGREIKEQRTYMNKVA